MGFEDEVEQSVGRPYRQSDSRFKRHYELTSSIVPRGTSFHGLVELECSPIAFDPEAAQSILHSEGTTKPRWQFRGILSVLGRGQLNEQIPHNTHAIQS
jgi:hypothetical protein